MLTIEDHYTIENIIQEVSESVGHWLFEKAKKVDSSLAGFDSRCGHIWIHRDFIAIKRDRKGTVDYYGGLEYVDQEDVQILGDFVFYSAENSRVAGHVERYFDNHPEESEEYEDAE